jgi:hypothetical protein
MTVGQIATETKVTAIIERIALLHVVLVMILSILGQRGRPIAGAATLAQRCRRSCEPVHWRRPNPTFRDNHHTAHGYEPTREAAMAAFAKVGGGNGRTILNYERRRAS